ncbi:recombinase family protein [Abyssogena phaseoliformis symbiont]|nr:recombinase family protein [Abyssogena phaseoliformis symbiont]
MMKLLAVIYCRVSSARQTEGELPIQSQLDACRAKTDKLGIVVLDEF